MWEQHEEVERSWTLHITQTQGEIPASQLLPRVALKVTLISLNRLLTV